MTPLELQTARLELGLSPTEMARAMGAHYDTYKKWQNGTNRITGTASKCVQLLLESHRRTT